MNGMIGKTIGKYRIADHLGRGGMAEVYKAYQPSLDRYVAIKLIHPFLADEQEFLARFEREAKVVATLRHPNIVQVYDFDVVEGMYYMVMEFINGDTLKARLQHLESQGEWLSIDDSARIILSVGSALKYAHERGMVHRDVKPANVMITVDGQVILTDFGIAKIISASNLTASGAMVGTPSYMAPEQGMGQPGDERSDIYSLGVMLYQLMLGRLPYDADTPLAVVLKHINEPLPMPQSINPDIPDELNRVILKTLAKNPADRYQKVGELMVDLRKAVDMAQEDSLSDGAKAAAIKLTGATMIGRVGSGLTPPPKASPRPVETAATTGAAVARVTATQAQAAASTAVTPSPGRPGWLVPVIGLAVVAIIAVIAVIALGGQSGGTLPTVTAVAVMPGEQPTNTLTSAPPATDAPVTTQPPTQSETVQVSELNNATASYDESVHINNCGGKADSEQTATHSFSTNIEAGADLPVGYRSLIEGEVSAKYGRYQNISRGQRLIAPPGTNMEFVLRWSEDVYSGNVTASGTTGKYEVHVPVAVEQISSQDLGCGTAQAQTPASSPTAISSPTPTKTYVCPFGTKDDVSSITRMINAETSAAVNQDFNTLRLVYFADATINDVGQTWHDPIEYYKNALSNYSVLDSSNTDIRIEFSPDGSAVAYRNSSGHVLNKTTQAVVKFVDDSGRITFRKDRNGCWRIAQFDKAPGGYK